jgi:hypothetical protein
MYNLANFHAYNNESLKPDTQVLLWSRATGYFFTTASEVSGQLVVIAISD